MKLTKITFTGLDSNTNPIRFAKLTRENSFIEWGILFSKSKQGIDSRYPSESTIEQIKNFLGSAKVEHNLSAHLCGQYIRNLLNNEFAILDNK